MDMENSDPQTLRIGYAGSLKAHVPGAEHRPWWGKLTDWFWTYRNRSLQHHTRSGYYLLKGVAEFAKQFPASAKLLKVQLWGMIEAENATQVKSFGISELVEIDGYFSKSESLERLGACDVLFLPLETAEDPLFIPGKIFDYLQLGKPVLVLGPDSDCTRILERAGVGIRVNPEDSLAVANALQQLVQQKDKLGELYSVDREYVETNFHFRNLARRMAEVFEE